MKAGGIVVGWLRLVEGLWWSLRSAIYCDRILRIVNRDSAVSALCLVTVYAQMRKRHRGKRTEECGSEPGHGGKWFHRVRVSKVGESERELKLGTLSLYSNRLSALSQVGRASFVLVPLFPRPAPIRRVLFPSAYGSAVSPIDGCEVVTPLLLGIPRLEPSRHSPYLNQVGLFNSFFC